MESQVSDYRYEKKFYLSDIRAKTVKSIIRINPGIFSEIYFKRYINNIYFDTTNFNSYAGNVEGHLDRTKFRIRWYGDLFGNIKKPILELKIKKGLLGTKKHFPLPEFTLGNRFDWSQQKWELLKESIPVDIRTSLINMNPVLLNRYVRNYYLSQDKKFRITIDTDLNYYNIFDCKNSYLNHHTISNDSILELKYEPKDEDYAKYITSSFPFRLTKSSKYVQGVDLIYT